MSDFPPLDITDDLVAAAETSKAWPFEEARKLVTRFAKGGAGDGKGAYPDVVTFETGYGPSGLPHIGTFGEVARTSWVVNAFRLLTRDAVPVRLVCFSDDMDGMRKVPDTVPDPAALAEHMDRPLSSVPDPFDSGHESFAAHNNARLRAFLDRFGFAYEFMSATECYTCGRFDEALREAARRFDDIMAVMLPTLGPERQATYSPFLPISRKTGRVLYVPTLAIDADAGTLTFEEDGERVTQSFLSGGAKLQWKPDFGMRWAALGVDFEMFGKDHQANMPVYDRICRVLGGRAPAHYVYELFLDGEGQKISKSKGNGLSVEQWLAYAPTEALALTMFAKPRTAKRMHFDMIPKAVDEYFQHLAAFEGQDAAARLNNPVWHIHAGRPPAADMPVTFSMLLNLVSAANASDKGTLWGFISAHAPDATPQTHAKLDELVGLAIRYFEDHVRPAKRFREPDARERAAMEDLAARLRAAPDDATEGADGEALQTIVYAVGKEHGFEPLRDWFAALYQVLLGQTQGPRFGSFAALYGKDRTAAMIEERLAGREAA